MRKTFQGVLILCILSLAACADKAAENTSGDRSAVMPPAYAPAFPGRTFEDMAKNLITRYNQLLVFGYENLNMNYLQEVATTEQAEKAYFHMAAIGEGGVRMRSRLNSIQWERIDRSKKDIITVKTKETWDFAYHDIKAEKIVEEHKDFVYHMTYTIAPDKNGKWLISKIHAVSDEPEQSPKLPQKAK